MKKLLTFCAVILAITFTAMRADVQGEFKFEKETQDFGKITQGKPVSYEFKFTNVGDQPIILTEVQPTCGCTVAKFTSTPVKKGEVGTISITYNAAAMGPFSKAITVKSNAKTSVKYIYIKGEVVSENSK
ncbi:DUF1573 domain-containing protein [Desertivirga brevis]|uniref:DUF1573 domain-containing protein n=1 Tax=Desertivirga brevis TaxID=2810310 RepID=UPI001A95E340|nr:DUF1573 domain-containing protein [Pedobacter sp. SYSU D00873]